MMQWISNARAWGMGITIAMGAALPAAATPIDLGAAGNFTVLGLPGTHVDNSLVTITRNEGIAAGGTINNMAPSIVTGNVYQATAGQYSGPGHVNGSIITNTSLVNQAVADALNASSAAKALSPTQTLSGVNSAVTLTGNGGVNVIDVNGDIKASLTLSGGANDYFIVNVTGTLTYGGNSALGLAGGLTGDHVLYNFVGNGGTITSHVGNTFYGTLLAPSYDFNLDGSFHGLIIGGGQGESISMLSGMTVVNNTSVPEPAGLTVAALGLGGLMMRRRRA